MNAKINIKRLGEITGFSQATVSNALNNKRGVNKETAERILSAAKKHGYITEGRIKNIKLVSYKNSGSIVADTPFFSALIEGAEMESRSAGYETTVCSLKKGSPDFEATLTLLLNDVSSAILLLATEMTEEDILPFKNALAPIVVLDNWFEEHTFDSILHSNTDSVFSAVQYLTEKGHKKIGYLKGNIRIKNFFYREMGYRRALNFAGYSVNPEYEFALTPTMDGAYDDMVRYLQDNPEIPTAFFADNDIIALGAMKALQEFGYSIPNDISIIGYDDLPFCSISSPALTTIRVPKQEMGRAAARRLIEVTKSETDVKQKTQVCNEFIERESVRDLREMNS